MGTESAQAQRVNIVFVPFPAQGHVTPMLHLARALATRSGVAATVAVPDFVHRRMGHQDGGDGRVALVPIPSGVPDDGGDEPPAGFATIVHAMEHRMPAHLEGMLLAWSAGRGGGPVACLVVDVLASWALPVAARCGVPAVGFWPVMFASYRVVAAIPELISKGFISRTGTPLPTNGTNEAVDKHQKIGDLHILPAKLELSTTDLPWLVGGAASQQSRFAFWLRTVYRAQSLHSILVNSFPGEGAGDSDRYDPPPGQHILHVGPLFNDDDVSDRASSPRVPSRKKSTAATTMWQVDSTCMDWLDRQSPGSVIYVSFGSWVAPIGPDKISQFALGLKAGGRPFLWVLKNHPSWHAGLPDRFTEAVAGRGKIVSWAPQEDILRHGAVGCYITHCGWNSTLEAIRYGVRMICYPISGDQFINRAYIVNMWEAGIPLVSNEWDGVRDCIERAMEGEEGRWLQDKVSRIREMIMAGEARSIAKRNLDLFLEGIEGAMALKYDGQQNYKAL